jgi:hypothetical protein
VQVKGRKWLGKQISGRDQCACGPREARAHRLCWGGQSFSRGHWKPCKESKQGSDMSDLKLEGLSYCCVDCRGRLGPEGSLWPLLRLSGGGMGCCRVVSGCVHLLACGCKCMSVCVLGRGVSSWSFVRA